MSLQKALEKQGISKEEFETIVKMRGIHSRGNSVEVKRRTDGGLTVYEVHKEKR